ncbi:MAG: hypothetical protein ABSF38_07430 [Verrucomicrobiota bacterium]|jgi:hypothetical protein
MRAKVIIPVVGLACLVLLLASSFRFGLLTPTQPPPAPVAVAESGAATPSVPVQPLSHRVSVEALAPARHSTRPEIDPGTLEEQRDEASRQRVAELGQWASTRDVSSLDTVLSELDNKDVKVRRAALAAAVEIGDRRVIPALEEARDGNQDPQEKVNIQQAIDFLKLPTLTEETQGQTASQTAAPASASPDGN